MMNCLKMNVMCDVRNGMDWNGKYMIHCGSYYLSSLKATYLAGMDGWMDLMEQETNIIDETTF